MDVPSDTFLLRILQLSLPTLIQTTFLVLLPKCEMSWTVSTQVIIT